MRRGVAEVNRELVTGLAQLSAEKGLPKEVVSDIIARAIKRAYGDEEHIDVKVDVQTGAFKVFLLKTVVEKVEDPKIQVQLDTAKKIKPDAQLGDVIPFEESAAALGRIGAQTAKQVIQQSLREAEREQVFAEYADREGDIIEWAPSPERYVANALEPAHVVRVDIVPDEKTAYVIVPDRQLSLAIGKEGQNARLAAKLTGWRIDIRSESEVRAEVEPEPEPEPVAVAEPAPAEEESEIRHDLVAEVEAESAQADEEDLDEEDRALLGGKKKRAERR